MPTTTMTAPAAPMSGHSVGVGGGAAAADWVAAVGSIADTSESRKNRLTPARKASATAAKIRPVVPIDPRWVTP